MKQFLFLSWFSFWVRNPKRYSYAIGLMIIVMVIGVGERDTTDWNSIILGLQHELEAARRFLFSHLF
jgi:hypothetical protein